MAYNQTIDFRGVGTYFQNGITKSNISFLQDATRSIFLNAIQKWPEMI